MQTEHPTSAEKIQKGIERLAFRAGMLYITTAAFFGITLGTFFAGRSDYALAFMVLTLGLFFMATALSFEGSEQTAVLARLAADNEDPLAKLYRE